MPALLALHVLGAGEAADRAMLAAVGALRDELESPQAIDADEAAGELRRAKPGLTTARAVRPLEGALIGLGRPGCLPHAAVDSFSHATRVSRARRPFRAGGGHAGNRPRSWASFRAAERRRGGVRRRWCRGGIRPLGPPALPPRDHLERHGLRAHRVD